MLITKYTNNYLTFYKNIKTFYICCFPWITRIPWQTIFRKSRISLFLFHWTGWYSAPLLTSALKSGPIKFWELNIYKDPSLVSQQSSAGVSILHFVRTSLWGRWMVWFQHARSCKVSRGWHPIRAFCRGTLLFNYSYATTSKTDQLSSYNDTSLSILSAV